MFALRSLSPQKTSARNAAEIYHTPVAKRHHRKARHGSSGDGTRVATRAIPNIP